MEIVLVVVSCVSSMLIGAIVSGYFNYHKGLNDGRNEAQILVDKDGLTKEEKEQLRQVINVLSWGGRNED